jgi:NAD-dependent dihydropyrimidine dehydrogenase PreA subunit
MPIPNPNNERCAPDKKGKSVSLTVLPGGGPKVRKSKMGPRRAAVLILVNVLIIGHLVVWWLMGKGPTLSPVEPSESMYTLEKGLVNAGFVFLVLSILSTLVFGRFLCGWGCHIVALQDLCGWMMKKIGVHPRPFRSRLLVFAPVVLAFWMFFKPTLVREVVKPLAGQHWAELAPYIGEVAPRPELKAAFVKKEFWETFPPWFVAIPFLTVCGFGCVYFLGAKGFCTYGCPYGGLFGPADKVAVGRILVTDACEHCGHCTSVCTSNVRVHEEVRDYGMVVDPGCMKCMDCVSVCPNDALYFGFARPAAFRGERTPPSKPHEKFKARVHDLSWPGEIAAALLFLALVMAFRGAWGHVPLLMAMGLAGIGVYLAWKLWQLIAEPNVRVQSLQLKLKGSSGRRGMSSD